MFNSIILGITIGVLVLMGILFRHKKVIHQPSSDELIRAQAMKLCEELIKAGSYMRTNPDFYSFIHDRLGNSHSVTYVFRPATHVGEIGYELISTESAVGRFVRITAMGATGLVFHETVHVDGSAIEYRADPLKRMN